jgi:hypothetical protein
VRGHDGVLARRAGRGLNQMGEREQGWVRERQLIQIGGDDDADEDTTSASSSLGHSSTYLLCRGDQQYLGRSHYTSYDHFGCSHHAYHISCRPYHLGSGRHP